MRRKKAGRLVASVFLAGAVAFSSAPAVFAAEAMPEASQEASVDAGLSAAEDADAEEAVADDAAVQTAEEAAPAEEAALTEGEDADVAEQAVEEAAPAEEAVAAPENNASADVAEADAEEAVADDAAVQAAEEAAPATDDTVLIAEEAAPEEVAQDALEEPVAKVSAGTLSVTNGRADYSYYGEYAYYSFSGTGSKFVVKVNEKEIKTFTNYEPEYSYYCYDSLYGLASVGTYKFTVTPYDENGKAGTTVTIGTVKKTMPSVSDFYVYDTTATASAGYQKPAFSISADLSASFTGKAEIWRSTKKGSGFKKITTVSLSNDYDIQYTDAASALIPGKIYYYKVRLVSPKNTYVSAETGKYSAVKSDSVKMENASFSVGISEKNKPELYLYGSSGVASAVEIYRATSRNGKYKKLTAVSASTYIDTSAKAGKTYYYKVRPYYYNQSTGKKTYGAYSNPEGISIVMGYLEFIDGKAISKSSAKLSWVKVSNASGYEIFARTGLTGDAYKLIGSTTKTSYTAKKLKNETYYFQVRAYKKVKGVKKYYISNTYAVPVGLSAPEIVTHKKTYKYASGKMTVTHKLKWKRVYGATGYKIYLNYGEADQKLLKTLKASKTSYTVKTTASASKRDYKYITIVAYKGNQKYSTGVSCSPGLSPVKGVKVAKAGNTAAKITWKKTAGATSYQVSRSNSMGSSTSLGTVTKTTFTDKDITPGVTYTYSVSAENSKLYISSDDDDLQMTGQKDYTLKVTTPKISSVKNSASKAAKITWKKNAIASKYVIYRATSKNGKYKKVGTAKKTATTFTDKKLKKGKTYYYKVVTQTVNKAGLTVDSAKSAAKAVKIKK